VSGELALSWSGGKDSALALWELRRDGVEPAALLTTITTQYERVSMHGIRRALVRLQADDLGLPLVEVPIPPGCTNRVYEERIRQALGSAPLATVDAVAFGDLFLADVRRYREELLSSAGKRGVFPLWGRDTGRLAREFVAAGFRAVLTCVDPRLLDPALAGREYDLDLLAELPTEVDPCGENGEFHTFVYEGPVFTSSIPIHVGEPIARDGFVFCDVRTAESIHSSR
jgi:uncharacterized protein (TIGR00290 family)